MSRNRSNVGYWTDAAEWVEWPFQVARSGRFVVTAEIAATGSGSFEVILGEQKLLATAPNTGDYARYRTVELGTVEIAAPGKVSLSVKPVAREWRPLNLRTIRLTPAP
jgi:alpha-L-fucosidase